MAPFVRAQSPRAAARGQRDLRRLRPPRGPHRAQQVLTLTSFWLGTGVMATRKLNKLATSIAKIDKLVPEAFRPLGYSLAFNSMVKLAGTAGIRVEEMRQDKAVVTLKNRTRVQNHIGGIHACGMALVSESATGIVVGLNVPDTALPLCKSMKVNFVKRCEGNIKAVATLTEEQINKIHTEEKGDVLVNVKVTDDSGKEPILVEMVWAWVPKQRKPKDSGASPAPKAAT